MKKLKDHQQTSFLLFIFVFFALTDESFAAQVTNFTPTDSAKNIQTVTARFSTDVVPLGDPRVKEEPFSVRCNIPIQNSANPNNSESPNALKYTTRWADTKNWVLEFATPLSSGVTCTFNLNRKVLDVAGNKLDGADEYRFSTSGPRVMAIIPSSGERIQPDQYFVIQVDGSVDPKSINAFAYFEASNLADKLRVKIVEPPLRDSILRAAIKSTWRWSELRKILDKNQTKPLAQIKEFENFVVITSERRFQEKSRIKFQWPANIRSKTGLVTGTSESFEFKVVDPFIAEFSCERTAAERPCNPILDMYLRFSQPVMLKSIKGAQLVAQDGKKWIPEELTSDDPKKMRLQGQHAKVLSDEDLISNLTFKAPFPSSSQFKIILPEQLKDDSGRALENQNKFPLKVQTDIFSPLLKFSAAFGILELKADPVLPVSVRNIEKQMSIKQISIEGKSLNFSKMEDAAQVIKWYQNVQHKADDYANRNTPLMNEDEGKKFQIPKPLSERELELVGIPLKKPGFYVVEMTSPKLGKALTDGGPMYVSTAALVTDMAVHFKNGRESSLVWVSQLSDAKPVSDAQISIVNARGREIASGKTNSDGTLLLNDLEDPCENRDEFRGEFDEQDYHINRCEIFVFAKKGDDFSFVSSTWSQGIEYFRFNLPSEYLNQTWGPSVMHSILDRMLAQPGDSIQMKHLLRDHTGSGFKMMSSERIPKRVLIVHQASQKTYTLPFEYDPKTGTATSKFIIPKDATLGRYSIYLSNKLELKKTNSDENDPFDWTAKESGHFVVSEYRIPLMRAAVKIQGEPLVRPSEVAADLSASYLSGGPARGLKVKLRATVQPGYFEPDIPDKSDYRFFADPIKVGLINEEESTAPEEKFLKVQSLTLNNDGGLLAKISDLPKIKTIQQLVVEMEYPDPNGEIKTTSKQVPIYPAENIIGLRAENWFVDPSKIKVFGVITNNLGKPQPQTSYAVEAFRNTYYSHRKRFVGGFYSYDSKVEVTSLGKVCEGQSDEFGRFTCAPNGLPAGSLVLQAKTTDKKGFTTYSSIHVSAYSSGVDDWWTPSDSDRIDLIPEKSRYEPGEKARLVLRSPFPTSKVLVTVEREGILDSFVTDVSRDNPSIEIPMKGNYAPNIFVSALAIRGRVGDPKPTALLDLARPAMKMGMAAIRVGWKNHELLVNVGADKNKYRTRENANIHISVKTASGENLPPNSEVAIAVVDEGLLRLKENTSWNILQSMMDERGLSVHTSSGQNQVVGRRHFGAKAKAPGGGGGTDTNDSRELFEPLLFWEPRLKLNSAGEADVAVPLNDSITSFRIVAVASGGIGHFGEGHTNIETNRDLILYSGFAPLVRDGDQIQSALTVRNTTSAAMKVEFDLSASRGLSLPKLSPIDLKANEAKTFNIPLTIPDDAKELSFILKAKDTLTGTSDSLKAQMKVEPSVPARVLQATLFQLDKSNQIPVKQASDAIAGKGGLKIHARASLVSGLAGVKSYMDDYPYSCLEQRTSRAIVLEDKAAMSQIIESLPSYFDKNNLLKFFPRMICGDALLTRYVLKILNANQIQIPDPTRTKVLTGLNSYLFGKLNCYSWWDHYYSSSSLTEKKILIMETLSRYQSFTLNMLDIVKIDPEVWATETLVAWIKLLRSEATIPNRDALLVKAKMLLRARLSFHGSLMNLQTNPQWNEPWALFTSRDQEALETLDAFMTDETYVLDPTWKDNLKQKAKGLVAKLDSAKIESTAVASSQETRAWVDDVGRITRGVLSRLRKGHWDTTMANAWGVTYMRKFSERFEKEKITGETVITANEVNGKVAWASNPNGESKFLSWPKGTEKTEVPVKFNHAGTGKPWMHLEILAAIPLKAPLDMGYTVTRKVTPVAQAIPGKWSVGDVANIEIIVNAKTDQSWVVVRDAIPAGASHLGTGLDGSSGILNKAPKRNASSSEVQAWPMEYEEKSFAFFTSYAAYLPKGTYVLNYRIRLNSAGELRLPPTRVEAMYSPEYFGEAPSGNWKVAL